MIEHPILMSAPMVRATLADTKTNTRRVLKVQPIISDRNPPMRGEVGQFYICPDRFPIDRQRNVIVECTAPGNYHCMGQEQFTEKHCPYGKPGEHLWVRETFAYADADNKSVVYRADLSAADEKDECWLQRNAPKLRQEYKHFRWRPSVHMPRWASRLTLEILKVRVERVQDISEEDAIAEGSQIPIAQLPKSCQQAARSERQQFSRIWDSINGKRKGCSWKDNPWVWVIEFRRVTA